ncbi:RNA N6-adenosine-methyltransferase METTL16 [Taenia solium]|eukprot:TsM_000124800 transcript=TsM_000124800 gene=TsM_000124800
MALNLYMHSRNPYKNKKPSFKNLVEKYPFFADVVIMDDNGKICPEFKQPKFLAALARALLLEDFGLDVEVPVDRLIPTIPLRLNYILWIEDILSLMQARNSPPLILDIGVGSCCVYPIIGAKKCGWNFIGSECDMRNYNHSLETVQKNGLNGKISLFRVTDDTSGLLKPVFEEYSAALGIDVAQIKVDVVMANPPFFEDVADSIGADSTRSLSRAPPKSASSAARQESQTVGGEVGFAKRLAEDSLVYKANVGVFTLMLGKKRSVPAVRLIMKEMNIMQTSVYEMCQGRVMRWGFAWTFIPNFVFPVSDFRQKRKYHRQPLTYILPPSVSCLARYTRRCLLEWLSSELRKLKMRVLMQKNKRVFGGYHLYAEAYEDTWTHARRRRREAMMYLRQQQQQVTDKASQSGERKRTFPEKLGSVEILKRRRLDEICGEGMAWIEELSRDLSNSDFNESELILKANFYVESQLKGYGGGSDDDDEYDEGGDDIDDYNIEETVKPIVDEKDDKVVDRLIISVEWLGGTDREMANRVLCYIKNRLK